MADAAAATIDRTEAQPDPMGAFAPAGDAPPAAPEAPWPGVLLTEEIEAEAAKAAEVPRPEVRYIGTGGNRVYKLLHPLKIGGREVRQVTMHHPTLWTIEDYVAGKIKTNFSLIGAMSDLPESEAGALRWPDAQAIIAIVTSMLPTFIQEAIEAAGAERKV